jgi:hypothetical protein
MPERVDQLLSRAGVPDRTICRLLDLALNDPWVHNTLILIETGRANPIHALAEAVVMLSQARAETVKVATDALEGRPLTVICPSRIEIT